ncbi:MAG: [FeFe] hydrogenase H-cluster radical SAM maturase HydE [bacterium]
MCYAIPGKLVEIEDSIGVVDYYGEKRRALINFANVQIGDYVYAQGGIIIRKISEREALEVLDAWKEMFFELKQRDSDLAKVRTTKVSNNVLNLFEKINKNKALSRNEQISLLKSKDPRELQLLYECANSIRQREHGNACCIHGIIEFSNYCALDCFYCGIRREKNIERYRMSIEEIIESAKYAVDALGFKAILLQSGEDYWYDNEILISVVQELRKLDILLFLSLGERDISLYSKLYEAGARAVLLRFETSNNAIYEKLKPAKKLKNRLTLIKDLKRIGFVLATGFLIGLPDETDEDIINNIELTKSLKPDMYSFGPFVNAKGTPLYNHPMVNKDMMLKIVALSRIMDRNSNILVTTAFETLDINARREGLLAGANSLMINITPKKYKNLYSIYENRAGISMEPSDDIEKTLLLLKELGRAPIDLGVLFKG